MIRARRRCDLMPTYFGRLLKIMPGSAADCPEVKGE